MNSPPDVQRNTSKPLVPTTTTICRASHPGWEIMLPKQVIQKIYTCGNDYLKAVDMLYKYQPFLKKHQPCLGVKHVKTEDFNSKPICTVISLLSKNNQTTLALEILSDVIYQHNASIIPSNYLLSVYKSIITMLGRARDEERERNCRKILKMIHQEIPHQCQCGPPPLDVYHVALSALGRCHQIPDLMDLLNQMESQAWIKVYDESNSDVIIIYQLPEPDRLAYLGAFTGTKSGKSLSACIEIATRMKARGVKPDKVCYHHILSTLCNTKFENRCHVTKELWQAMEQEGVCDNTTYEILARIFSKEKEWKALDIIMGRGSLSPSIQSGHALTSTKFQNLEVPLERFETKTKPWYKLGHGKIKMTGDIVFGIQQHRHPAIHGLSMVFYSDSGTKMGYILLKNERNLVNDEETLFSAIQGMYIDERHRGKGLARNMLSVWLEICLRSDAFPRSEMIHKPLLSLALSSFGFEATSDTAVSVEICPVEHIQRLGESFKDELPWQPLICLYSANPEIVNLAKRDSRGQRMMMTNKPPNPRGKTVQIRTCFEHSMTIKRKKREDYTMEKSSLMDIITKIWEQERLEFYVDDNVLRRVIFGYVCWG